MYHKKAQAVPAGKGLRRGGMVVMIMAARPIIVASRTNKTPY